MNCLILAAGHGSRLKALSDSKPLTPVGGMPLIEHVVRRAAQAGASSFTIVTGHMAEQVEEFLAGLALRLDLPIVAIRMGDWDVPNGHSVVAGAGRIAGDYLLLMSDHLFDPALARGLIEGARDDAGVTLLVDRQLSGPLLDVDDATKVEVDAEGRIVRIGKELAQYNAIDTGIFLATPALAEAIREAIAAGAAGSLSDGMQRLAASGRAYAADAGEGWWIDVDDPRMHALAEALVAAPAAQG
jgi:choline kinase